MKYIFLIAALILLGCSKSTEDPINNIPPELIGKWKITERFSSTGNGDDGSWNTYDSGKIVDLWFKSNGKVIYDINQNCNNCTFTIANNQITYYPYDNPSVIEYLSENELILRDKNAIEPYKTKYKKVAD